MPLKNHNRWGSKYEYKPTGILSLEILSYSSDYNQKVWSDRSNKPLEGFLNEFLIGLVKSADSIRKREREYERQRLEQLERERILAEKEALRAKEQAKIQSLVKNAEAWFKSTQIRAFIQAVKEKIEREQGRIEPGSELDAWLNWANKQADRLDPLTSSLLSL